MKPTQLLGVALLTATTLGCQKRDTANPDDAQACTEEAKICPDGSSVARSGPDCDFAPCPDEADPAYADPNDDEEDAEEPSDEDDDEA
jgi:hypothetical protein